MIKYSMNVHRVLQHYRFSKIFALVNRNLRSRRKVINKVRILYRKFGLISNGCSLCVGDDFSLISEGDRYGFDLNKQFCNQCGLVQTYPSLSAKFHKEFYSYHYRPLYLKSKEVDYQSIIKEQTDKGEEYLNYFRNNGIDDKNLSSFSIIEIGCSSGGTLNILKPFFKSVQGCDLDIKSIEFAKANFDVDTEVSMYPTNVPKGDKIFILSHVLEHVENPLKTLMKIRKLMKKGDYLFLAVPGLNMVAKGSYKNDLRRYFHIAHVTDFTSTTLTNVANCAGFKNLNIDEKINGLFLADEVLNWKKHKQDSIENIQRIEKTYHGIAPHL
jgi:SAM-dependent methyltransferase